MSTSFLRRTISILLIVVSIISIANTPHALFAEEQTTEEAVSESLQESEPAASEDGEADEKAEVVVIVDESDSETDQTPSENEEIEEVTGVDDAETIEEGGTQVKETSIEADAATSETSTSVSSTTSSNTAQDMISTLSSSSTGTRLGGGGSSATSDEEVETSTTSSIEAALSDEEVTSTSSFSPDEMSTTTYENLVGITTASTTTQTTSTSTATSTYGDDSTIVSGQAVALANILNIVNTNFVNSNGVVVFQNFFETLLEDFDLRKFFSSLTFGCSLSSCSTDGVRTTISSDAHIENDLYVSAVTGGNLIEGADGATITTGDAYAGVNLVNVANTNVIDSNYLLLTMNAFKNVEGDIVFPSLEQFLRDLGGGAQSVDVTNTASVDTNVSLVADTGGNSTDAASSSISTGVGKASGNIFNNINTSLVGGQSVSIIFRVHGSWAGEIFGAPPGLAWMEDGAGGIYLFEDKNAEGAVLSNLSIAATNTASIRNNIEVVALTGDNAVQGANTALISTGNAYAGANILNIANATVVGRNWILAIVNIFGDFKGNIAFGRPDLWIGGQADVPASLRNGSEVTYTATILNNGDSTATGVKLSSDYDERYLKVTRSALPYSDDGDTLVFTLPNIPPGGAAEVSYTGVISGAGDRTNIENTFRITGRETDNELSDNTDIVTIATDGSSRGNGVKISLSSYGKDTWDTKESVTTLASAIEVSRATKDTYVRQKEESEQRLTVYNSSQKQLRNISVYDRLYDANGTLINEEVWNLGDVLPNEEISISYAFIFGQNAERGAYSLSTEVRSNAEVVQFNANGTLTIQGTLSELLAYVPKISLDPVWYSVEDKKAGDSASTTVGEVRGVNVGFGIAVAEASGGGDSSSASPYARLIPLAALLLSLALLTLYGALAQHTRITGLFRAEE